MQPGKGDGVGLFGGRSKGREQLAARQQQAITDFWRWWDEEGMARSSSALADAEPHRIVAEISAAVEAIAVELAWEFAKGDTSMHRLVVTADGDPQLRAIARRWLEAAPEGDVFWSYADARPPMADVAGSTLELDGVQLPLSQVQVGVRRSGTRIDVQVHHPQLESLNPKARTTFCFLAVDAAIGETMTETWIGELQPALVPPMDGFGLAALRAVVRDLADDFSGDHSWVVLEGTSAIGPVRVHARVPLAAVTAPKLNQNVIVTIDCAAGEDGLPTADGQQALDAYRSHLVDRLEGQGELVAVVMNAGECQFIFYVDGTRTGAAQISAAATAWNGKARTEVADDPGWANVAHLRG